ncbi:MAG TPA: LLM class flavin-dependent oxidoreductase [Myxococcota bacterium]|nr:LLM class flavin-dependent oxidoreductase [Myxococcota bacterium]
MSEIARAPLGVAFTAHWLRLDAILRLTRRADALGYALVIVDGDASLAAATAERPIYDSTALCAATALATRVARVASIHFAHFWNAALLARNLATLQELAGGRLVSLFGVGAPRQSAPLGLPQPGAAERITRLDETLDVVRALLAGETVTRRGQFVALDGVRVTKPSLPSPIAVSAAGPRALELVQRHADIWDANVPPLRARLEPLRAKLGRALPTWIWVFARPGESRDDAIAAYRRHAPWFAGLSEAELSDAVLWGEPERCRERLAALRAELDVALPIADLTGLDEKGAERALAALV